MKNNSTKDRNRKKLAQSLSEILNNPETPEAVYNAISDVILFYNQFIDYDSAEVIEMAMKAYDESGNGQAPSITREGGVAVIG